MAVYGEIKKKERKKQRQTERKKENDLKLILTVLTSGNIHPYMCIDLDQWSRDMVLLDFSLTVKAAPHECVIRTSQR